MLCGRWRPSERFGGRGPKSRICRNCKRMPKVEQQRLLRLAEIHGFLEQSNISKKNIKRLSALESDAIIAVAELASLVKRIAVAHPRRRRRWKWLRRSKRELAHEAAKAHLIDLHFPPHQDSDDDPEWPLENEFLEDCFELGDFNDIWIEARSNESEPTSADVRRACGNWQ